ncbi:pyruvate, phosphate dikinase [Paenibacillus marchantiophytorum]|uniref:Pyruvate, phosphate dikinase n=1 Tax=Paenibacillus marchantiophytorum TaxID=1619310 RepID=A0ABQ1ENC4_9BACL|nr:pyruvate, phosphate dikinase [Paenibacillus marchantiophytorum]GFZ79551.1 pyruvate, phosphate dikinase [Paenibacillus marchantiophytorum]
MSKTQVIPFQDGHASMKALLGGKGANLAEMTRAGLPVPPGFTITTEACLAFFKTGNRISDELYEQMTTALKQLEKQRGQSFGDAINPLLVSVRSGSVSSMPGMMDTILNLGLNDTTVQGLANLTQNERFAYDCYRRLIQMFGNVVLSIESRHFEKLLHHLKETACVEQDQDVTAEGWKALIEAYKQCILTQTGRAFPQNVYEQLRMAVEAVFKSWNNSRAQIYRKMNRIPDEQGTAVNIQSMVFGNMGSNCGTGVVFTRNPSTGENTFFGEYLINAQGEDVVAGTRTPLAIQALKSEMPGIYEQLFTASKQLEKHYKDMQDIEFTVENNKLYLLQTRNGKRNAQAALKMAVDMVHEGLVSKQEAVGRIEVAHLDQLLHRGIQEDAIKDVLAKGLPASPGAAVGQLVFDADTAAEWHRAGKTVILARSETTPEDIHGVIASEGVLTSRGGMTSHAAVVARGMGKPCVCGCEDIRISADEKQMLAGGSLLKEGDWITLDGATGRVIAGVMPLQEARMTDELLVMLAWADEIRSLKVYANADNPEDAILARQLGAQGIGLCRTEHMFFSPARLPVVQRMILADDKEDRLRALAQLLPMQQSDFEGIFEAMTGLPVTIRLLDPPLHEFLPNLEDLQKRHAQLTYDQAGTNVERDEVANLLRKVQALHEANPMLGQRGCRLGIVFPEIYDMQIEAIFRAASSCTDRGIRVLPEIMIPLVGHANELKIVRELVDFVAEQVLGKDKLRDCPYKVGTMIEVPRAALTARQIVAYADFFSFGTNDLTQMTFGYSRDDAEGKFLSHYVDHKLLPHNPFQVLDTEGVGQLIELAVNAGRLIKPALKTGICGEHGGDKESIFFCHLTGLDYVSCSPYRIPLARIAAAQAFIQHGIKGQQRVSLAI